MDLILHRLNKNLLDSVDASSNVTSEILETQGFSLFCVHHYWSGVSFSGAAPVLDIQGSNSLNAPFVSIKAIALTVGGNASLINNEKAGFAYLKIVYTANSATTGVLTSNINAKVL